MSETVGLASDTTLATLAREMGPLRLIESSTIVRLTDRMIPASAVPVPSGCRSTWIP